jgi:hypothetical protein
MASHMHVYWYFDVTHSREISKKYHTFISKYKNHLICKITVLIGYHIFSEACALCQQSVRRFLDK